MQNKEIINAYCEEFGHFDILLVDGRPLLPLKNCAEILRFSSPLETADALKIKPVKHEIEIKRRLKNGVIELRPVVRYFITETDLLLLIGRSKAACAGRFKEWMFNEIIPSIYDLDEDEAQTELYESDRDFQAHGAYDPTEYYAAAQNPSGSPEEVSTDKELMIFQHPEFGELEIWNNNGKPFFPGVESAQILAYKNTHDAITRHCNKDGVVKREVVTSTTNQYGVTSKQTVEKTYISEGNLYRLIARSKLPAAVRFESYVFDEVVPSIRKYGAYATPQTIAEVFKSPGAMAQLFLAMQAEQDANAKLQAEKTKLLQQAAEDAPKVEFANTVAASDGTISVGTMAKILRGRGFDIGRTRLFEQLREWGYLLEQGSDKNMPSQWAMDLGLFRVKEMFKPDSYGRDMFCKTTMVTGLGQQYILRRFLQEFTPQTFRKAGYSI